MSPVIDDEPAVSVVYDSGGLGPICNDTDPDMPYSLAPSSTCIPNSVTTASSLRKRVNSSLCFCDDADAVFSCSLRRGMRPVTG